LKHWKKKTVTSAQQRIFNSNVSVIIFNTFVFHKQKLRWKTARKFYSIQ